jgi:DNA replication ATP-dependent helicase Dna2
MIIDNFRGCGVDPSTITVICPFLEQANMLGEHLKPVKVLTIDKAQGIDCDIVIISCTKQTGEKGMLLRDFRRLNVAITRAKKKLILIGTHKYLTQISPLDEIIAKIDALGWT